MMPILKVKDGVMKSLLKLRELLVMHKDSWNQKDRERWHVLKNAEMTGNASSSAPWQKSKKILLNLVLLRMLTLIFKENSEMLKEMLKLSTMQHREPLIARKHKML